MAVAVKNGMNRSLRSDTGSPCVAVERCFTYADDEIFPAVERLLKKLNLPSYHGISVLLKPNLLAQYRPEQSATTHPALVDALCRYFMEQGCKISIGDSMAFYQGGGTALALDTTGMAAVAGKYGAKLLPFERTRLRKITSGRYLNPFYITSAVFEHDLVVNIPKMKVHRLARYTGAIKNMYGTVVGGSKQRYHMLFQSRDDYREYWGGPLVDVFEAANPRLTVMDAVYGLDEDGPAANGTPRHTGLLLASENGAALDVAACRVMGFDPQWVPAVREAIARGLVFPEKLEISGELPLVPYVRLPDEEAKKGLSKKIDDHVFEQFMLQPRLKKSRCTKCGSCVADCAPGAIHIDGTGYPRFNQALCISCYCCEGLCPEQAVYLHGGCLNHLIRAARCVLKI